MRAVAGREPSASSPAWKPCAGPRATLARGVGVSGLNPKGLLLFLALLPQFTSPRWSWPLAAQLGFLGLVFMLTCGAFYFCLGSSARKILHARPAAARAVTRFSGAAMIVIGPCSSSTASSPDRRGRPSRPMRARPAPR
jgi:threonine/homoserine/homoserine lactone efflux protein